jgi:hypothetical protein
MHQWRPNVDPGRPDLHNVEVHTEAAMRQLCGNTHLASGRVCVLPARHRGGCEFRDPSAIRPAVLPTGSR